MDLGLKRKRALVLGAGGGLGNAVALALAAEGALVVVAGRTLEKVEQIVSEIKAAGGQAVALAWDLRVLTDIPEKIQHVKTALGGPVEILFNNGGGPPPGSAQAQQAQAWKDQFDNLVMPVIAVTDAVLPEMKAAGWGRILTNASSGVVVPIPNLAMSNSLRGALVGWNKTLSREVAGQGITVNMVLPGRIATERTRFLDEAKAGREGISIEEVEQRSRETIPAGRYGNPQEFGAVVAFLASTRASYITGSMVRVDGGAIPSI